MGSALEGLKVLEFATDISGPYCGKLLGDFGADVVKAEPPRGDVLRSYGPFPGNRPDPEKSALFLYLNTSKRGVTVDLDQPGDLARFKSLVEWADVLIDSHPKSRLESLGLGWESLQEINPRLVYTAITPYGRIGRRSGVKGGELTLIHAGGLANLLPARSTDINRPPVKPGGNPVGYPGGIVGALSTLSAVIRQKQTGRGQMVDVSLHDVVCNLIFPLAATCLYNRATWSRVPDRPPAMGRMQTRDGYLVMGAADDHHFRKLREMMGKPLWLESDDWDDMAYRLNHLMDVAPQMEAWMRRQNKADIFHDGQKSGIPVGPLFTAKEVMEDPQYAARQYFVEVDHPVAGKYRYPGWPYRMSASPPRVFRPAPLLGQHNQEIFSGAMNPAPVEKKQEKKKETKAGRLPLEGIRILDFSWVVAGPYATKLLADLGAEVIKIEGHKRTELMRRSFAWPISDEAPTALPVNQGIFYNCVNINKKSVTIDLGTRQGHELACKLVEKSDIVIDNMRPGAMEKLGLGYETLLQIRPDIIVLKSSSRGLVGPQSQYLGFAVVHHSLAGAAYITGYPDDHPSHATGVDADVMNAQAAAYALLAAVYHRTKTGEGQFIDYSQTEGISSLIGEVLLGFQMTNEIPERMGNAHPLYAPHNVYPCWGVDRWLALEIHSDEEFRIFADVIRQPDLAVKAEFADMGARKKNEAGLDRIIGEWTRSRDRDWMVKELCHAGLAAAPSRDFRDLYADPHLTDRESIVAIHHPELGELKLFGMPWKMSETKVKQVHAPLLGEHTAYVLKKLLGLSGETIEALRRKNIIL
jgi:crotonobetainyl-CoA:carnitine CoA-transferase CaiB-like acyl-CoA transferase